LHVYFLVTFIRYRSDDESCEGANIGDPTVDFEQEASQTEDEEDEDVGLPPELERIIARENREMKPHREETKLVDLGFGSEKKEVKVGMGMTALIREELVALPRDYQDVFAWSYQDMPGLNFDIVQHKLPVNPECSLVKQKLRRMKPEMSLKIKRRSKEAIRCWLLGCCSVPGMGCQHCASP